MECEILYDVFLSFAGADRAAGLELVGELTRLGLAVFTDEDIRHFAGITESIRHAMSHSRALVAYYSADYATRPACQLELMAAVVAGQRAGEACEHIIVVNPERGAEHIVPVELADARYTTAAADLSDLPRVAQVIRDQVRRLPGPIGDLSFTSHSQWLGRRFGSFSLHRRFRETWDLHCALHSADFPLTGDAVASTAVSVWGEPAVGKSELVEAYAYWFGPAFPGGVFWLSAAGPSSVYRNYLKSVRSLAHQLGLVADRLPDRLLIAVTERLLACRGGRCLWVVDDLPQAVNRQAMQWLIPSSSGTRTVLISEANVFDGVLPTLELRRAIPIAAVRLAESEAAAIASLAHAESDAGELEYLRQRASSLLRSGELTQATRQTLERVCGYGNGGRDR